MLSGIPGGTGSVFFVAFVSDEITVAAEFIADVRAAIFESID
jgi:hypothetical protein